MSGLRFSITAMLAGVAVICVGLAALNAPSPSMASALTMATTFALLFAILATIYRNGETRAFWLGVSLFGWFYFIVVFTDAAPEARACIERPLRAVRAAIWTTEIPDGSNQLAQGDTAYDQNRRITQVWPAWSHGFGTTIHCLANLFVAIVGGVVGRLLYWSSGERKTGQSATFNATSP